MNATSTPSPSSTTAASSVLTCAEVDWHKLAHLLGRFGLKLERIADGLPIPGSYWGESESGLLGERVLARADTPIHSLLHEASHAICAGPDRRAKLDTDALSDEAEENAVCVLQILLADQLPSVGSERLMADMDAWGYSFRLGSTRAFFEQDAAEARQWLIAAGLARSTPLGNLTVTFNPARRDATW
jgi:hypothetical protein